MPAPPDAADDPRSPNADGGAAPAATAAHPAGTPGGDASAGPSPRSTGAGPAPGTGSTEVETAGHDANSAVEPRIAGAPAAADARASGTEDAPPADTSPSDAAPVSDGAAEASPADPALFAHALRIAEALVFASDRPATPARLQGALPPGCDARAVLTALAAACAGRPVQLAEVAGGFSFRTAPELAPAITRVVEAPRRLPRAAMETLAIVAYHQPVTRAEIEEIRGASLSQSTLELLLDASLIAPRGRKEVPGRPSLWGTTPRFLEQFGLKSLSDLPRREELVNEPTLPFSPPAPQPPPATDAAAAPQPAPATAAALP
jgi:segregation and condensation protein B